MPQIEVRNILVGAGYLYTSDKAVAGDNYNLTADVPGFTPNESAKKTLDPDPVTKARHPVWLFSGATQGGLEVSYEPDYGEVEVDQLKDAALLFHTTATINVNTSLVEGSLESLALAWGYPANAISGGVFSLGVKGDYPVERSLVVVGNAPRTGPKQERVYHARRVISADSSAHTMNRTEATLYPVSFRMLPDSRYEGEQYGTIRDRSLT